MRSSRETITHGEGFRFWVWGLGFRVVEFEEPGQTREPQHQIAVEMMRRVFHRPPNRRVLAHALNEDKLDNNNWRLQEAAGDKRSATVFLSVICLGIRYFDSTHVNGAVSFFLPGLKWQWAQEHSCVGR